MKILIISYYYSLEDSTGSLRARAMEKYFPQNGIEVAVLTNRVQKETVTFSGNIIGLKDLTRSTLPLPLFYLMRIWQKTLRLLGIYSGLCGFWRETALKHADEIIAHVRPDAILASYPSIEGLEVGLALAKKYGLPLISDFRDGLTFEPLDPDVKSRSVVRRHYQEIEARVVAESKLIVTISQPISRYFEERYSVSNVMTLPNGFDVDSAALLSDSMAAPALSPDVINLVHTGRIKLSRKETAGKGRGVHALSTALTQLVACNPELSKKINVHFVGALSSSEKKCLAPLAKIGIVQLWGHRPRAVAIDFQRKADILLLITAPDQASIATGKIFEYLAANKPILALTRGTAAERIILETGAGIVTAPDIPAEITNTLKMIIQNKGVVHHARNQELIMTYSRARQMTLLASKVRCV